MKHNIDLQDFDPKGMSHWIPIGSIRAVTVTKTTQGSHFVSVNHGEWVASGHSTLKGAEGIAKKIRTCAISYQDARDASMKNEWLDLSVYPGAEELYIKASEIRSYRVAPIGERANVVVNEKLILLRRATLQEARRVCEGIRNAIEAQNEWR